MPANKSKLESQLHKDKLVHSYQELLEEFSSKDVRNVGNYNLGKLIGKGSFGKVYLATHKLTNGSKVVLKSSNREDANLAREIHHHRQFIHPHIARLYEVIVTEKLVWLALEYCPGDELYNYLIRNGPMPLEKVQRIFAQLVGAVSYVHSKSCVHRDLKLENILLDKHENVKLCDFGFTREYEGKASYLQTFCGTVCYSAPEMLKGEKYAGEKVDVWSLGIILFALIAGELPYDDDDDQVTKTRILTGEPTYNDRFPEDAKSLISQLLSKRPLLRPTLCEVLNHTFLAEHAPQQQAILKLARPPPFSTPLEKTTLERMRSAGVNIDQVIESVLAQRCDTLAGWWALLIEKEERKEKRRERKRREREAESKNLRRLSAASSRLERISAALVEVDEEEGHSTEPPRSRGRRDRRSITTPQIVVPDLPKLPETAIASSPASILPPPPIEKDSLVRSSSSSRHRPTPPPKEENRRSRASTLHLSASQPDLSHPHGILRRHGTRRRQHPIISQLASIKHWLIESTKRAKSPHSKAFSHAPSLKFLTDKSIPPKNKEPATKQAQTSPTNDTFNGAQQTPVRVKRSSTASSLTPSNASYRGAARSGSGSLSHQPQPISTSNVSHHRNSLSPSPLTPRNSYRRLSGLHGRKSTSSSVSSIRSIHHAHSHSKTSSVSSNSINTTSTPAATTKQTVTRSPHSSVKVLAAAPSSSTPFPSNIRIVRGAGPSSAPHPGHGAIYNAYNEAAPSCLLSSPPSGLVFARRKRSPFKGPFVATSAFPLSSGPGTPGLAKSREGVIGASSGAGAAGSGARKSQIIMEEEDEAVLDCDDEDIEEVDTFSTCDETALIFRDAGSFTDDTPTINTDPGPISPSDLDPRESLDFARTRTPCGQSLEEPQLLPDADIQESACPPFHPAGQPVGPETPHSPRSLSLDENPESPNPAHSDGASLSAAPDQSARVADDPTTPESTSLSHSKATVADE
ncbi:CAMK/CAMKL/MARK protein kinase [Paracoccidioides brasiliensis]|uniref:CAMK/CAMKL/MARK protein kinase n=1 Tax=Paracoccidioides brasiliensis TaxID=121759 RepID=A0A1D2JPD1_PARBR|nr:CAMK/CAMKL/MARK protein kinase [Paracoccidioides brasiliensis]